MGVHRDRHEIEVQHGNRALPQLLAPPNLPVGDDQIPSIRRAPPRECSEILLAVTHLRRRLRHPLEARGVGPYEPAASATPAGVPGDECTLLNRPQSLTCAQSVGITQPHHAARSTKLLGTEVDPCHRRTGRRRRVYEVAHHFSEGLSRVSLCHGSSVGLPPPPRSLFTPCTHGGMCGCRRATLPWTWAMS